MKINRLVMLSILMSILNAGCMYALRYDGTYRGKIVDETSKEPIEAVVVLGVWNKEYTGAPGTISEFYDARETVTDKNGEFKIQGQGLRIMTNLAPMNILIFKAGYSYFGTYTWNEFKRTVKFENNKPVVRLRKLTMEERWEQGSPDYPSEAPEQKIIMMLKEINKDRIERRLKPVN